VRVTDTDAAATPRFALSARAVTYLGWGLGSFCTSVLVNSIGLLHLRFMTDSLGIAAAMAGMLVAISKIYDTIANPLTGIISDRTTSRWGRRRPYLFVGAFGCALAMILLFNVPHFESTAATAVYMGGMLMFYATFYSLFRTPYLALPPEITSDFQERSKLMQFSVYGSSVGSLFATTMAPYMLDWFGGGREAHADMSYILAGLILIGGLGCFAATSNIKETKFKAVHTDQGDWRHQWRTMLDNRPFVVLIVFKVVMFIGFYMHGIAIPYFSRHVIKASDTWLGSIYLARTLTMIVSQPFWAWLARRYGRRNALMAAGLLEVICMLSWVFITTENALGMVIPVGFLQGLSSGGIFFGLYTTLPDTMEYDRRRTGLQREGVFAGIFSMVEKITNALAVSLFGITIGMLGYLSSTDAGATAQPESAIQGIYLALCWVPTALSAAACFILRYYNLSEADLAQPEKGRAT